LLGDSGNGKSSTIRQILNQVAERGHSAIVYDPAREYVRHYFNPSRGDIVLNPLDARCPFWMPGDEIGHPAEADMLAESIFPIPDETPIDKRFFFTAARDVLVELLKLSPTPAQLYRWMCDEEEMIRMLRGTHVISQIAEKSPGQRSGVFGTLTQAAKMFEFLPDETDRPRWSARKWAERREGWIFLTSLPMLRGRLRPLITLWIEQLLLRVMNDEEPRKQTYFILDELASLPRIEQLVHALCEARKASATIVVSLQGKAQQDVKYGRIAQAMVSMAATKILMGTSEPEAARWISDAIGEVEIERYRESRTKNYGSGARNSDGFQCEIAREPLVIGPQIMGLPPLHAYLRHGNFVVPIRMPFIPAEKHHTGFIRRSLPALAVSAPPTTDTTQPPPIVPTEQTPERDKAPEQAQEYF
jgi:type IV secretory pathway TraG/TraD family ATPase VirD4